MTRISNWCPRFVYLISSHQRQGTVFLLILHAIENRCMRARCRRCVCVCVYCICYFCSDSAFGLGSTCEKWEMKIDSNKNELIVLEEGCISCDSIVIYFKWAHIVSFHRTIAQRFVLVFQLSSTTNWNHSSAVTKHTNIFMILFVQKPLFLWVFFCSNAFAFFVHEKHTHLHIT